MQASDPDVHLPACPLTLVAQRVDGSIIGSPDMAVSGITHDSTSVRDGWLFACIRGASVDGHRYANAAVKAGASALLVDHHLDIDVPQIVVDDVRSVVGHGAAEIYGNPSLKLKVLGVTGTNGKTSVVHLISDILRSTGATVETIGTLSGGRTTPEGSDLQRNLALWAQQDVQYVAMEVSSHALDLHRVAGTRFAAAVFTNLGIDHLDFHQDMEAYFDAKAKLFTPLYTDMAVVNVDDQYGRKLLERIELLDGIEATAYGQFDVDDVVLGAGQSSWTWNGRQVSMPLVGSHNVINAVGAAKTVSALGFDSDDIIGGLATASPVRGRFETVDSGQPFLVAVDYAHTPDALQALSDAGREVAAGRVILVFGCGGDRDKDKRPEMGSVASQSADFVVVTSDNPRSESPEAIIDQVVSGIDGTRLDHCVVDADRRAAIGIALGMADRGDIVLIAGKGHETTQVVGDETLEFDDVLVVEEILSNLKANR